MATCKEQSSISIYLRYIENLKKYTRGRILTISNHDKHYEKLPINLNKLEKLGFPIEIFIRGKISREPICIYNNEKYSFENVNDALQFGRDNSSKSYRKNAKEDMEYVLKELKKFNNSYFEPELEILKKRIFNFTNL